MYLYHTSKYKKKNKKKTAKQQRKRCIKAIIAKSTISSRHPLGIGNDIVASANI